VAEFDSVIPAGGSGTLTARIETTVVQHGKVSKSVTVHTDDPESEVIRLVINFEAVASIIATPRLRLHLHAVENQGGSARILLHRPDGERLEVKEAAQDSADFPVDLKVVGVPVHEPTTIAGGGRAMPGDVWLEATMAPHGESIRWTGRVTVETNHPNAPNLEVPLSVWVQPVFDVRPQRVNLWIPEKPTDMRPVTVRVTHAARKPFAVTKMEVSHPELFSATALTASDRRFHTVRVQLNNLVDVSKIPGVVRGNLRLHTSDPEKPVIDIQVGLSPLHERVRRPAARHRTPTAVDSPATGGRVEGG
jgi:acetolactate synthase regulatory subunit